MYGLQNLIRKNTPDQIVRHCRDSRRYQYACVIALPDY